MGGLRAEHFQESVFKRLPPSARADTAMAWTAKRVPGRNPLPRARLGLTNGGEHSASDLYLLSGLAPGGSAGAATTMNEIPALATSGLMNWVTLDKVTGVAPSPRHGLSATLSGKRVIVYGGVSAAGGEWDGCVYSLQLSTLSWSRIYRPPAPPPSSSSSSTSWSPAPRTMHASASWSATDSIVVFGGLVPSSGAAVDVSSDLCFFSTKTNKWESWTLPGVKPAYPSAVQTTGENPGARWGHTCEIVDGKMFLIGGFISPPSGLGSLVKGGEDGLVCDADYVLDLGTKEWTRLARGVGLAGHASCVVAGFVLCWGGYCSASGSGMTAADPGCVYALNARDRKWFLHHHQQHRSSGPGPGVPSARTGHGMAVTSGAGAGKANGTVFLVGGETIDSSNAGGTDEVWVLDSAYVILQLVPLSSPALPYSLSSSSYSSSSSGSVPPADNSAPRMTGSARVTTSIRQRLGSSGTVDPPPSVQQQPQVGLTRSATSAAIPSPAPSSSSSSSSSSFATSSVSVAPSTTSAVETTPTPALFVKPTTTISAAPLSAPVPASTSSSSSSSAPAATTATTPKEGGVIGGATFGTGGGSLRFARAGSLFSSSTTKESSGGRVSAMDVFSRGPAAPSPAAQPSAPAPAASAASAPAAPAPAPAPAASTGGSGGGERVALLKSKTSMDTINAARLALYAASTSTPGSPRDSTISLLAASAYPSDKDNEALRRRVEELEARLAEAGRDGGAVAEPKKEAALESAGPGVPELESRVLGLERRVEEQTRRLSLLLERLAN